MAPTKYWEVSGRSNGMILKEIAILVYQASQLGKRQLAKLAESGLWLLQNKRVTMAA
jgi:hypothetical protein